MDDALSPTPQSNIRQRHEKLRERADFTAHASPTAGQKREWQMRVSPMAAIESAQ